MTKLIDIKKQYPNADSVIQVGSKQLFIVDYPSIQLMLSYNTVIGFISSGLELLTAEYYSSTTSRHKSELNRRNNCSMRLTSTVLFNTALRVELHGVEL